MPVIVTRKEFEEVVTRVIAGLPARFARALESDVRIEVRNRPTPKQLGDLGMDEDELLLGLYEGVPLPERNVDDGPRLPDVITLFFDDACDAVDELNLGDEIDVTYRLTGRKWQKDPTSEVKYFLSAEAMGFNKVGSGKSNPNDDDVNDVFSQAASDDEGDAPF